MQKKNKKGFTIVELVVVIAVIGILSAILIPTFMGLSENARAKALQSDLSSIYTQYAVEAADGVVDGYYRGRSATNPSEVKIQILSQDQVVIGYKEAYYHIPEGSTKNEWVLFNGTKGDADTVVEKLHEGDTTANPVVEAEKFYTFEEDHYVESGKTAVELSKFAGYVVYAKA